MELQRRDDLQRQTVIMQEAVLYDSDFEMNPRERSGDPTNRVHERIDVLANQIATTNAAIAREMAAMQTTIAVQSERDRNLDQKMDALKDQLEGLDKEVTGIKELLTEAKGGWRVIILIGTVVGVVVGWVLSRTELLGKVIGH